MKFPFGENTTISRLYVPYSGDQLAARLRYGRLFGGMSLHPASLPPNAVVCIRKLRDPQSQNLPLNRAERQFSDTWRDSVSREIEKLYRRAYRPIRETVPARAESVVFSDKAELLACLANDFCRGILNQNWWWQSLFPNLERAQTIARIWIESAEFAPTAFVILAKMKIAAEFVNKLQPEEIAVLLKQVIETFGLKKLQNALFEPLTAEEIQVYKKISEDKKKSLSKKNSVEFFHSTDIRHESEPETRLQNLSFEKEILLEIGLTLARAPHIARSEKFAKKIRELKIETELFAVKTLIETETFPAQTAKPEISGKEIGKKTSRRKEKKSRPDVLKPEKTAAEKTAEKKLKIVFDEPENLPLKTETPLEKKSDIKPETQTKKRTKKTDEIYFEKSPDENSFEIEKRENRTKIHRVEVEKIPSVFSKETTEESETEEFEIIVHTKFGGVFYLLNLGLYMKLYRDFSEPLADEIDLNIWDFIALLSHKFLGKKIEKDEVWNLLKQLSGRERVENFGEDFSPPDEWRIPTDWLKTFPTGKNWFWSKTKNRLIVRHSEKFNVIDVPLKKNFKVQLDRELENYREFFSEISERKPKKLFKDLSPRERFLENLFGFAERRLVQALNLEKLDELNKILFGQSATVAVSATHLEVTFRLADLPLAVRFAGLDRNPAWIPAAGKYIEFHFV